MVYARALRTIALALVAIFALFTVHLSADEFPILSSPEDDDVQGVAFDGTNFLVTIQKRSPGGYDGAKLVSPAGAVLATVTAPIGDPPEVAFGSGNYLLAWAEKDHFPTSTARGLLVSTAGAAIGVPFQISQSNTLWEVTGIAFDGTNYLVIWTDQRRVVDPPNPGDKDVYGRFVSPAGVPVGNDFKISGAAGKSAVIAFAAPNYLVAWGEDVSDQEVHARTITPAGVMGSEFTVNASAEASDNPLRMATDGTDFFVVWNDEVAGPSGWDLFGQRVSAAGALLGPVLPIATTPGTQFYPFIAFDGTNYLVTWTDLAADTNGDFVCDPGEGNCEDVHGQFVSAAGALVGENMLITPDAGIQAKSPTGFGAGKYLVAWTGGPPGAGSSDVTATFVAVDHLAHDGFESDSLLGWSAAATDGGDLGANSTAPLDGAFDLQAVVNDLSPLYVEDDTPLDESHYRARFLIDPSGFDPGEAQNHFRTRTFIVFEEAPLRRLAAIVLKRQGSQYSLEGRARLDSNAFADTGFFDLTSAPHAIELEWKRAAGPASGDGEFRLWIDGTLRSEMTDVQNNRSSVDFVRLGALSLKGGASGVLHWDDFASGRETYIGP